MRKKNPSLTVAEENFEFLIVTSRNSILTQSVLDRDGGSNSKTRLKQGSLTKDVWFTQSAMSKTSRDVLSDSPSVTLHGSA